jgi:hypothetical protein
MKFDRFNSTAIDTQRMILLANNEDLHIRYKFNTISPLLNCFHALLLLGGHVELCNLYLVHDPDTTSARMAVEAH